MTVLPKVAASTNERITVYEWEAGNPMPNGEKGVSGELQTPESDFEVAPVPARRSRRSGRDDSATAAEALLRMAIDLFAQHGYDAVSTGDIAKAAGLTQSMVHYHFGSKEALWKAAVDELMGARAQWSDIDPSTLKDLSPLDQLKIVMRGFVRNCIAEPKLPRILVHEGMSGSPRLTWLVDRHMAKRYEIFDSAFSAAVAAGAIRPLPIQDITNIVIGAAVWAPILPALLDKIYGPLDGDSFTDSLIEIIFHGLAAPLP